ncbi:hypothetical protein ABW19_dt0200798 [Dactylella cylindrospora]|nr:hypothetical protein ABW19_dt0200798 [Dactylella cylindrospora]
MTDHSPSGVGGAGTFSGRGHARHPSSSTNGDQSSSSASEDPFTQSRSEPITRRPSNAQVWIPGQHLASESTPVSPTEGHIKPYNTLPNTASVLYSPATTALSSPGGQRQFLSQSPFLHPTHRQPVKETHLLDVDFDPISGRKSINSYEVINEIGRGVHGKVKLGRNLENGEFVAIKIVERNSRPRLGKPGQRKGSQEEKVKREIAILKKCRHENVVRLIEVIDDPESKKVYLVLEFVELGEVKWRRPGDENIAQKEALRLEKLRALALGTQDAREEEQRQERQLRRRIAKQQEAARKAREERKKSQPTPASDHMWSLEFGGETEDSITDDENALEDFTDESHDDETPTAIQESADINPFTQETSGIPRNYSLSTIATNTSDSYDPDLMYVPSLTMEQARQIFRDTVLGLEYLHYQGIIHRDIKPANLLWSKTHRVKISDFGVSYLAQGTDEEGNLALDQTDIELAKTVGTPAFFAPELCYTDLSKPRPQITEAIDIWALGVTLYCLIFARCPFLANGEYELYHVIATQELFIPNTRLRPETAEPASGSRPSTRHSKSRRKSLNLKLSDVPEDEPSNTHEPIPGDLKELLQKLLTKDPARRITLAEVKRHGWVLQGLEDPISWIEESDPRRVRPVEISREDVDHAVAPATVLGRVRNSIRKVVGGLAGAVGLRRRAHSAVIIPSSSDMIGSDGTADDVPEVINDRDTEAQKALKREKNLAPPTPQQSSPLRRATSVTAANKEFRTSVVTSFLPPVGGKAPPATPIAEAAVPQYEVAEAHHSRRGHPSSQFSSRLAIGRLLRASKSRDMHKEFRATETSSEPGDMDVAWPKSSAEKEKKGDPRDKHFNSMRGWSGVIRRGSRQSCDSIMRLAAGFSDNRSSRSASPMPSMPSSPSEDPKPVFPSPTPNKRATFPAMSDHHIRPTDSRDVSPISAKSQEGSLGNCPPSPDDVPYLDVLASRSNRDGVFSGDDSSFSNATTKVPASQNALTWDASFSARSKAIDMDREISPGSSVKSPTMSPRTRSPRARHQHTRSFHFSTPSSAGIPERQALTSSSSEEHFGGTSSLSNSTSFPSVLSASSSLSTDDHWSYNSLSPKMRLNSGDHLNNLPSPTMAAQTKIHTLDTRRGLLLRERQRTIDSTDSGPYDLAADGAAADIEDAAEYSDDDDEDEGFFLNLSSKKKDVRSNSTATSARPQLTQQISYNRRKSIAP